MFRHVEQAVGVREAQGEAYVLDGRVQPIEVEGEETQGVLPPTSRCRTNGDVDRPGGVQVLLAEQRLPEEPTKLLTIWSTKKVLHQWLDPILHGLIEGNSLGQSQASVLHHIRPVGKVHRDRVDVPGLSPIRHSKSICPDWEEVNHPFTQLEFGVTTDILLQLESYIVAAPREPVHFAAEKARAPPCLLLNHSSRCIPEWGKRAKPRRGVGSSGRLVRHNQKLKKEQQKGNTHNTSHTHTSLTDIRAKGFPLSQDGICVVISE